MKAYKGLYFLFNIVFILASGYLLAPLPSAQSIAREWVVRVGKQIDRSDRSFDKSQQLHSMKELMENGMARFIKKEKQRGQILVELIQKQLLLDLENGRIDQIIGIIQEKYLDRMSKEAKRAVFSEGKPIKNFYILSSQSIEEQKAKNSQTVAIFQSKIPFDAYYLITSRSGKKFLMTVKEDENLEVRFLLVTHPESKEKWEEVRIFFPNSFH